MVRSLDAQATPRPLAPGVALRATVALIVVRAAYAYNWFDVGPALPQIGSTFGVGPAEWGLLVAAFLVSAGLFQVPAGFLSRRYGSRAVSLIGAGILAVGAAAAGAAPSFAVLLALRLVAGVGAALFFSPAIGLVASLYPRGHQGVPVGVFSSAFSLGSAAGIVVTALILPALGWQLSLVAGGVILGVPTLVCVFAVPPSVGAAPPRPSSPRSRLPAALRYPGVWAVGIAFIGLEGATSATAQFIVPWGESVQGWSIALAGVVGMMFVLPSFAGGPIGGRVAERYRNHRTQFLVATVIGALALATLPWAGLAGAILVGVVFSLAYGVIYAVMYVLPHYWREVPPEEIPLAIGLLNSIQLAGGAGVSAAFGAIVAAANYSVAWEVLVAVTLATLVALVFLPATPADAAGPLLAAEPAPR
ncbi:MAG TPA: MFS transporter [Thermoplasmata archaeon]|nr:MFS transporter [Thermoplasmata archaeon]